MNGIESYCKDLKTRLEPTENQKKAIKLRLDNLRSILEKDSYFHKPPELSQKTYLHGSYLRNTMIRKASTAKWDVDIMVIYKKLIPNWMANESTTIQPKPQSVFDIMKAHLANTPPLDRLIIKQNFPCITVSYKSDNLDFEIMPVYFCDLNLHTDEPGEKMFSIPHSHEDWKSVFPLKFNKDISSINNIYDGKLVHTIKLLKHWNNSNEKLMSSFLIEKLALRFFIEWARASTDKLSLYLNAYLRGFFTKALEWLNEGIFTPFRPSIVDDDNTYLDEIYRLRPNLRKKLRANIDYAHRLLKNENLSNWKTVFPYI